MCESMTNSLVTSTPADRTHSPRDVERGSPFDGRGGDEVSQKAGWYRIPVTQHNLVISKLTENPTHPSVSSVFFLLKALDAVGKLLNIIVNIQIYFGRNEQ